MRPDLGRRLAGDAEARLAADAGSGHDVVVVIADGLSARAVEAHARPLLVEALPRLKGWRIAPLVVVRQGRVAIGEEIANALRADIAVVMIGERPGLSAPDSMGAYLTFKPTPQTTDAERNCISNIRPEGLAYADAAVTLTHLLRAMRAPNLGRATQGRPPPARWRVSTSTAPQTPPLPARGERSTREARRVRGAFRGPRSKKCPSPQPSPRCAGRGSAPSSRLSLPFIPAHSASKTRVNALMLGIQS